MKKYTLLFLAFVINCGQSNELGELKNDDESPTIDAAKSTLTVSNTTHKTADVSFSAADDNSGEVFYAIVFSTEDNIGSLADIVINGKVAIIENLGTINFVSFTNDALNEDTVPGAAHTILGLTPNTTYYVNVVAGDSSGNNIAYTSTSFSTGPGPVVMYLTKTEYASTDMNVDRATVNGYCEASLSGYETEYPNLKCENTVALFSFPTDAIADFDTNYSVPFDRTIVAHPDYGNLYADESKNTQNFPIADSINLLLGGTPADIQMSHADHFDLGSTPRFWSSSNTDGTYKEDSDGNPSTSLTCSGWTDTTFSGLIQGGIGDVSQQTGFVNALTDSCDSTNAVACLCWND